LWFTQKAGIHDKGNNGHCCTHISYNDWLNHMKTVLCRSSQMISTVMLAFVLATLLCIRQHTWMQSGEFCVWGHLQIQESLFPT
jgi:hypothetical protein